MSAQSPTRRLIHSSRGGTSEGEAAASSLQGLAFQQVIDVDGAARREAAHVLRVLERLHRLRGSCTAGPLSKELPHHATAATMAH